MSVENTKRRLKRANDSMDAIREKIKVLKKELIDNENADIIRGVRRAMTFDEFIEWIKLFNEDAKKAGIGKSDTEASEIGAEEDNLSERTEVDEKENN